MAREVSVHRVTKTNNATVIFFSEIYEHFPEIHILFTSHSYALTSGPLSCVFLANYMPKCQMSSGPFGPIFPFTVCCAVGNSISSRHIELYSISETLKPV